MRMPLMSKVFGPTMSKVIDQTKLLGLKNSEKNGVLPQICLFFTAKDSWKEFAKHVNLNSLIKGFWIDKRLPPKFNLVIFTYAIIIANSSHSIWRKDLDGPVLLLTFEERTAPSMETEALLVLILSESLSKSIRSVLGDQKFQRKVN